jgi:hypothetical protein
MDAFLYWIFSNLKGAGDLFCNSQNKMRRWENSDIGSGFARFKQQGL